MRQLVLLLALLAACVIPVHADPIDLIHWLTSDTSQIDSDTTQTFAGQLSGGGGTWTYDLTIETVVWTDLTLNLTNVAASLNGTIFQTGEGCQLCSTYLSDNWWLYQSGESMEMWSLGPNSPWKPYELWTQASGPTFGVPTPEPGALDLLGATGLLAALDLMLIRVYVRRRRERVRP